MRGDRNDTKYRPSTYLSSFFFQMKVTFVIAAVCIAVCLAEPAVSQGVRTTTTTGTKPGRFLSLPSADKCSKREFFIHFFYIQSFKRCTWNKQCLLQYMLGVIAGKCVFRDLPPLEFKKYISMIESMSNALEIRIIFQLELP